MTRVCAIMQPTWLPYLGYFHLIAASDSFVLLDDVQFARRSWQSRNRILGPAGEQMLTVPVRSHDRDSPISAIEIDDRQPWRAKQLTALRHAYARRPFFGEGMTFMEQQLERPGTSLAGLTGGLIIEASRRLGLTAEIRLASELGCTGARSEHLLAICRAVGAEAYLSTAGSADYMAEDGVFAAAGMPVRFQGFVEVAYDQGREPFTPFMAFIDAVMNLGWDGTRRLLDTMAGR